MYWRYFKYVFWHKVYVWQMGRKLGIPWLALLHDNSKFLPSEFLPYAYFFYGKDREAEASRIRDKTGYYKPQDTGNAAFDHAWFLHQKRNKHHWQYWVEVRRDFHVCAGSPQPPVYGDARNVLPRAPQTYVRAALLGLLPKDDGDLKCVMCGMWLAWDERKMAVLPMPEKYRREMLADWWGAGKAQGKHSPKDDPWRANRRWYAANKDKMRLHPATRQAVEGAIGYPAAMLQAILGA